MEQTSLIIALHDPGAAHALAAALPLLRKDKKLIVFAAAALAADELNRRLKPDSKIEIIALPGLPVIKAAALLKKHQPRALLCGLSDPQAGHPLLPKVDRAFLQAARRLGLPAVGLLETPFMPSGAVKKRINSNLATRDRLILASEKMQKILHDSGFADADMTLLPMPKYAETAVLAGREWSAGEREELCRRNGLAPDELTVLYATSARPPVDEAALKLLQESFRMTGPRQLRFCFHPGETAEFQAFCRQSFPGSGPLVATPESALGAAALLARGKNGLMLGVTSSLLFDARLAGCNVAAVNPGQNPQWRASGVQLGLMPEAITAREIRRKILSAEAGLFRRGGALPEIYTFADAPARFVAGLNKILAEITDL